MDLRKILSVMLVSIFAVFVFAYDGQAKEETGFDDKEIRVGQWGPQTGPAAAWGSVARGSKLVFEMVNEEGGIHGRQIKYFRRTSAIFGKLKVGLLMTIS